MALTALMAVSMLPDTGLHIEATAANASAQSVSVTGTENWSTVWDFSISTSGSSETDYTYDVDQKLLTIKSDTSITIKNTDASNATDNRIYVESGVSADVTLAGVNIACVAAPFEIAEGSTGDVTVTLADGTQNTLTVNDSKSTSAALQKNGAYSDTLGTLTIRCEHVGDDHVCSSACGSLSVNAASTKNGAGIGSGSDKDAAYIYQGRKYNSQNLEWSRNWWGITWCCLIYNDFRR